jgi:hypothetical protein
VALLPRPANKAPPFLVVNTTAFGFVIAVYCSCMSPTRFPHIFIIIVDKFCYKITQRLVLSAELGYYNVSIKLLPIGLEAQTESESQAEGWKRERILSKLSLVVSVQSGRML